MTDASNPDGSARTRWGPTYAGLWMLVILVAFSGVVGMVIMPTLAAVLVYAAVGSIRPGEIRTILSAGRISQIALITTFAVTLVAPVAVEVGIGIALSLLLQLNREAVDLAVVELVPDGDRTWTERPAPRTLASNHVTVMDVYGSLFYARRAHAAGAPAGSGGKRVGGRGVAAAGSHLAGCHVLLWSSPSTRSGWPGSEGRPYLSGLDHAMADRLRRTGGLDVSGPVQAYEAVAAVGESTEAAYLDAMAWVVKHPGS